MAIDPDMEPILADIQKQLDALKAQGGVDDLKGVLAYDDELTRFQANFFAKLLTKNDRAGFVRALNQAMEAL